MATRASILSGLIHRVYGRKSTSFPEEPLEEPRSNVTDSRQVDTVSLTKIDLNTVDYVQKKNGKEVVRGRTVVSKDGETYKKCKCRIKGRKGSDESFESVT